jgi:mycothiol synthase
MTTNYQIQPFNVKAASQDECEAFNRHTNHIRRERLPDDPPIPLEETLQQLKNIPPFLELKMWCAWNSNQTEIVAQGNVVLMRMEENQHMAQFDITVQPEYRCQGIGRSLLALATEAAQADNRRLLITETIDRIPGGEAFMSRLGAQKGMEGHVNQLRLADLDRSLLDHWLVRGEERNADFQLGLWDGPYPEEQLGMVAQLFELTNQQPLGDLEIEDSHITPEQIRQMEQMIFSRGNQRWTIYVI